MSIFSDGMSRANAAFAGIAGETFALASGGTYEAVSIDELGATSEVAPGGLRGTSQVNLWLTDAVIAAAGIAEGVKLVVRSKRVRVLSVTDDGDGTQLVTTGPVGVKL